MLSVLHISTVTRLRHIAFTGWTFSRGKSVVHGLLELDGNTQKRAFFSVDIHGLLESDGYTQKRAFFSADTVASSLLLRLLRSF